MIHWRKLKYNQIDKLYSDNVHILCVSCVSTDKSTCLSDYTLTFSSVSCVNTDKSTCLSDYTLAFSSVSCVNTDKSTCLSDYTLTFSSVSWQVDLSVLTHDTLEKVKV
jgi:propanediol dehydratase small subunit